jgi:NAD(P)-dependent dehydrogenase (short-subunit alcohol dehydrogenase family)
MSIIRQDFAGGIAVITGAGSGIGEGLARVAAVAGMKVVLADISTERVEAIGQELIAAGYDVLAATVDVSSPASLDRLAAHVHEHYGPVRLLINNAGVETLGYTWELPAATWDKTLAINLGGVIHGVRAFIPDMIARGQPACIANVASVGALTTLPVQTSYAVSKHAVLAFTECLSLEVQQKKLPIQVSVVMPGPVSSAIFEDPLGSSDAQSIHHRDKMRSMLTEAGLTPLEAARRIFAQITAGGFWVSTHPELTQDMARRRADHLRDLRNPAMPDESSSLFR